MKARARLTLAWTAATLWLAFIAGPASAGAPVTLKAVITDPEGHVTLGELFDDAGPARDVVVAERIGPSVVLDAAAVQAFAHRYGLDWDNPKGLRRIIVRGAAARQTSFGDHEVLTYARNLAAGQIVTAEDLLWSKAVAGVPVDAPANLDVVIGMAARRPLRQGDPVLAHDLVVPTVIKAGDDVLVTYADGAVTLTLQAKATSNAAVGESVSVLNTASKKLIEAVASGPDQAVVGPQALRLKAERNPSQIALR
jgi:flagella basal body P-ring formation protein FlgA